MFKRNDIGTTNFALYFKDLNDNVLDSRAVNSEKYSGNKTLKDSWYWHQDIVSKHEWFFPNEQVKMNVVESPHYRMRKLNVNLHSFIREIGGYEACEKELRRINNL